MSSDDKNGSDIPFDDRPGAGRATRGTGDAPGPAGGGTNGGTDVPRARAESGPDAPSASRERGESGAGAGEPGPSVGAPPPPRTEDRDRPRSGSTGPTGMREDLGTLVEEASKLWSALEGRFIGPAVRAYPDVTRHLGAAGRELLAAYRSAVGGQEQAWRDAGSGPRHEKITVERVDPSDPAGPEDRQKNRD